jgi:hypothetical protein
MILEWQKPWMVLKKTKVQTLIPTIVFWPFVDHTMIIYKTYIRRNLEINH